MLNLFKSEIRNELKEHPPIEPAVFNESELSTLPEPVLRYFKKCGWVRKPKMTNAAICISDMKLKLDLNKDFLTVQAFQFNSVSKPMRIAFMKAWMFGCIPISGRDKYQNGAGNMLIKLMNLFPLANAKGTEIDHSALVTVLAETFLLPAYALQPYIQWHPINGNTAGATITDNGTSVSGIFYFDDHGELHRFETQDRYMSLKDGSSKQAKWIATFANYQNRRGITMPTEMSAFWVTEAGRQEYARMKIDEVRYDIKNVDEVFGNV